MIQRRALQCQTCGRKIIIRTAVGHDDYQEFAFPCPGCGVEIRYGMELLLNKRMRPVWAIRDEELRKQAMQRVFKMKAQTIKYKNAKNLKWCKEDKTITDIKTFDGETLNPITGNHFSPFMATVRLPKNFEEFRRHHSVRHAIASKFWPQVHKALIHLERKQWPLFDKQYSEFELGEIPKDEASRVRGAILAVERIGKAFRPGTEKYEAQIRQRIALSENVSIKLKTPSCKYIRRGFLASAILNQIQKAQQCSTKQESSKLKVLPFDMCEVPASGVSSAFCLFNESLFSGLMNVFLTLATFSP